MSDLFQKYEQYFEKQGDGFISCKLNGHRFKGIDQVELFISGKKFPRLVTQLEDKQKLGQLEPFITPSKYYKDILFCALTGQHLVATWEAASKHVAGKKFQKCKEKFQKDQQELFEEGDPSRLPSPKEAATSRQRRVTDAEDDPAQELQDEAELMVADLMRQAEADYDNVAYQSINDYTQDVDIDQGDMNPDDMDHDLPTEPKTTKSKSKKQTNATKGKSDKSSNGEVLVNKMKEFQIGNNGKGQKGKNPAKQKSKRQKVA